MKVVPIKAVPSQVLTTVLGGQNCRIAVYQKSTGLFLDLSVDNAPVVTAAICRDRVNLVRQAYLGFSGGLVFCDTQGVSDPTYDGLGTRYLLTYLETTDLA